MGTSPMDTVAMADEAARVIQFLRTAGTEEQRIVYAVLEGMRLQKAIDSTDGQEESKPA